MFNIFGLVLFCPHKRVTLTTTTQHTHTFSIHNRNTLHYCFPGLMYEVIRSPLIKWELFFSILHGALSFIFLPLMILRSSLLPCMGIKSPHSYPKRTHWVPYTPWDTTVSSWNHCSGHHFIQNQTGLALT